MESFGNLLNFTVKASAHSLHSDPGLALSSHLTQDKPPLLITDFDSFYSFIKHLWSTQPASQTKLSADKIKTPDRRKKHSNIGHDIVIYRKSDNVTQNQDGERRRDVFRTYSRLRILLEIRIRNKGSFCGSF